MTIDISPETIQKLGKNIFFIKNLNVDFSTIELYVLRKSTHISAEFAFACGFELHIRY